MFRSLSATGRCSFKVIGRMQQLSPIASPKKAQKMVNTGKIIPSRDEELGIEARKWLKNDASLLLVIDDLEHDRREMKPAVFDRYRVALDTMLLTEEQRARASVHFLVNMLEAYYFADSRAVSTVLRMSLSDFEGDVEEIRHPKSELKNLHTGFDEVEHGARIVRALDVDHILDNPETCASLRVLFAWCAKAIGLPAGAQFRLDSGCMDVITGPQLGRLP